MAKRVSIILGEAVRTTPQKAVGFSVGLKKKRKKVTVFGFQLVMRCRGCSLQQKTLLRV